MAQKSTEDIKPVARSGYYTGSLYTMPIKTETILLSAIFLPDRQAYHDDDIVPEVKGVTVSQALYNVLGEVAQEALHLWSFTAKVQEVMALRYGLCDGQFRPLEAVGKSIGMTRQGVYIIERHALQYLRLLRFRRKLLPYIKPRDGE
jgi:hypothetical protein